MNNHNYCWFYLSIVISLFFISCKQGQTTIGDSSKKEVAKSKFAHDYPNFNPQDLQKILETNIQNDSILQPFYAATAYTPVWIHDTLDTRSIDEFIQILDNVDEHGLSPERFYLSDIKSITDSISSKLYGDSIDIIYDKIITLEKTATKAVIKYISGMKFGFVNPKKLYDKKLYDITLSTPDSIFFVNLYEGIKKNPIKMLLESHPSDSIYIRLQNEYKQLATVRNLSFKKIVSNNVNYKVGDKSKNISAIAERLMLTGEYMPDTLETDSLHRLLDEKLLAAINSFRKKNSYLEEKEVGKLTIDALNRPIEYYINRVRANMERHRWQRTKKKHDKHIEVNVAAFMLVATDQKSDSLPLISRVCVGTVGNKTPLLESDISYMNLNPVWNVPKSIAQGEIAVLQKKDPTYIKRKNMKLYKGGKEVDPESIDWSEINPSKFSYIVRQESGYGNSLGLIKFMFDNKFSVYLHDTPSKSAFNKKKRAVSHGCVRVQKPFELAVFCMSPVASTYKDQLHYSVNKPVESKDGKKLLKENKLKKLPNIINIPSENKISLSIDYYTTFTYPNDGDIYYADDIYEYDTPILAELELI